MCILEGQEACVHLVKTTFPKFILKQTWQQREIDQNSQKRYPTILVRGSAVEQCYPFYTKGNTLTSVQINQRIPWFRFPFVRLQQYAIRLPYLCWEMGQPD